MLWTALSGAGWEVGLAFGKGVGVGLAGGGCLVREDGASGVAEGD